MPSNLHGLLVIDKPGQYVARPDARPSSIAPAQLATGAAENSDRLPTSHDVVQKVRRWSGQRRIGHTGTLDPMASGVLVLCLGLATRLVEYYQGHAKRYYAEIELGTATDTYDATGTVTAQADVPSVASAQVEAALTRFRGTIQQHPPAFSALKQGGETAYRKARRGETIDLPARTVTFYSLELIDLPAPTRIALRAHCSAGTYMRSLAYDLGAALGVPAHLAVLRREAAGAFTLDDAHSLAAVEAAAQAGRLSTLLHPPGARLDLPAYTVDAEQTRLLGFGQKVELTGALAPMGDGVPVADGTGASATGTVPPLAQAYSREGQFLGIIRCLSQPGERSSDAQPTVWKAEKWLVVEGETV